MERHHKRQKYQQSLHSTIKDDSSDDHASALKYAKSYTVNDKVDGRTNEVFPHEAKELSPASTTTPSKTINIASTATSQQKISLPQPPTKTAPTIASTNSLALSQPLNVNQSKILKGKEAKIYKQFFNLPTTEEYCSRVDVVHGLFYICSLCNNMVVRNQED